MYSSSVLITDEALNCILHLFFLQMEARAASVVVDGMAMWEGRRETFGMLPEKVRIFNNMASTEISWHLLK